MLEKLKDVERLLVRIGGVYLQSNIHVNMFLYSITLSYERYKNAPILQAVDSYQGNHSALNFQSVSEDTLVHTECPRISIQKDKL